jgi:hypothetical protein
MAKRDRNYQPVEEGRHPDLDWLDWKDPVTQLDRLQTAVRALAEGSGTWQKRMDKATYALIFLRSEDLPKTWPRCDFVYPEDVDPPLETK